MASTPYFAPTYFAPTYFPALYGGSAGATAGASNPSETVFTVAAAVTDPAETVFTLL